MTAIRRRAASRKSSKKFSARSHACRTTMNSFRPLPTGLSKFIRTEQLRIRCVPMMNTLASNFLVAARAVLPFFIIINSTCICVSDSSFRKSSSKACEGRRSKSKKSCGMETLFSILFIYAGLRPSDKLISREDTPFSILSSLSL